MTNAELLAALARECPNGVSFDPMALRLLRQKIQFENWQIKELKTKMFQLGNGLWFSPEMISDNESLNKLVLQVAKWLVEHRCFSVKRLFDDFCTDLFNISTPEDCAKFLRHLGFFTAEWGKVGHFCFLPPRLEEGLLAVSHAVTRRLEEGNGALTFHEIEQGMPYLTAEALEGIRAQFLPDVHSAEVGGIACWCSTEAIHLPEDFGEKVTTAVDTLVELNEKVSVAKLEFALNLFYRTHFREEYALRDNDTFVRVCDKHYQGENDVFPSVKKSRGKTNNLSAPRRRVRSPNTRFSNLGVPVGSKLVFTKDSHITCTVLDEVNQVEYDGKAWSISTLAIHLLGVSSGNGFCHFSYAGEVLWDRRLRLERAGKQEK